MAVPEGHRLARRSRLFGGAVVDGMLVVLASTFAYELLKGAWEAISGAPVAAPVIGFMSSYSAPAQNGYWFIVHLSIIVAAIICPVSTILFGRSPGKWLFGVKFLDDEGMAASAGRVLKKTAFNIVLYLLLVLPGPVIGFIFGAGADGFSLLALAIGFAWVIYLASSAPHEGRTRAYAFSGIWPVVSARA